MMMSMLNPSQKQQANDFKNKTKEQQCQEIADYCNKNGITKEQLQELINKLKK